MNNGNSNDLSYEPLLMKHLTKRPQTYCLFLLVTVVNNFRASLDLLLVTSKRYSNVG